MKQEDSFETWKTGSWAIWDLVCNSKGSYTAARKPEFIPIEPESPDTSHRKTLRPRVRRGEEMESQNHLREQQRLRLAIVLLMLPHYIGDGI